MEANHIEFIDFSDIGGCALFKNGFGYNELPSREYLNELRRRLENTIDHYDEIKVWGTEKNASIQEQEKERRVQAEKVKKQIWHSYNRYVYLIKNTVRNVYKIGLSKNPKARMRQLQTVASDKLELIGFKSGDREFERYLHKKYDHLNLSGEWFSACPQLIDEFITNNV